METEMSSRMRKNGQRKLWPISRTQMRQWLSNERIQSVVGQLPIRLTRNKFFAMVEEGLSVYKGGPVSSLDEYAAYILEVQAIWRGRRTWRQDTRIFTPILREFERADFKAVTAEEYRHLTAEMERAGQILLRIPRGTDAVYGFDQ